MPIYTVNAAVTIGIHKHIRAGSKEEAKQKARKLDMPGLCYGCSSNQEGAWTVSGLDGEPVDIDVQESTVETAADDDDEFEEDDDDV